MKKLVSFLLFSFCYVIVFSQTLIDASSIKNGRINLNNSTVNVTKAASKGNNNSRAVYQFDLDYDAADEQYAIDLGFDYLRTGNNVNTRFNSGPPSDTADNFTAKWVAVKFDTLYNGITRTGYPLAGATITVDSIFFLLNHINTSGLADTLIVRILEIAASPSGLLSTDQGITLTNNVLWADTTITTTSLTLGLSAGQITVRGVGPNLTLPTGSGYIVQILYSGPKQDRLVLVDGNRDECGGSCIYAQSIFPDNSWGYLNWYRFNPPSQNLSGIPQLIGLGADCNQDGQIKSEDCEFFSYQNFAIWSSVSVDIPLSVSVAQSNIAGCPGTSVPLSANAVGGAAPYNYSWSNGQNGSVINVPVGSTNQTYTVTVTDANNAVRTATVTVTSQGVSINLGADRSVACGQTTNISPSVSGNVIGASYLWSTGATTLNLINVGAGIYAVTVTNSAGCTATDNIIISLPGTNQVLNFNSPSQFIRNCPLNIFNQSVNTTGWNFEWNFGDGNISFIVNPTHSWTSLGTFTITLVADSFGCLLTRTKTIQIVNGNCPNQQNCSTPQANPGIYPDDSQLTCITQGTSYQQELVFKNVGTIGGLTVEWLRIDSIVGLPQGISWNMSVPSGNQPNQLLTNQQGCINLFGTTNTLSGQYEMLIYVCVKTNISPNPLCGELNSLIETIIQISPGTVNPYDLPYYLNVCGSACNLSISGNVTNATVQGATNGIVNITISNGTAPYTYTWSNGATTKNLINVASGNYTVTVTDNNGCSSSQTFIVYNDIVSSLLSEADVANIYPNPTAGDFIVIVTDRNQLEKSSIKVYDTQGKIVLEDKLSEKENKFSLQEMPQGMYLIKIETTSGNINKRLVKY